MSKQVILCIDDEMVVIKSLKVEIQEAIGNSCIVEIAQGGKEALELIEELQEDEYEIILIISDYIMPDIKGDELLKEIHLILPKALKIMLTGQADIQAVGNAIKYAKLYRYITKPWQSEDLILTVKEAINSYVQAKKLAEKNIELQLLNKELEKSLELVTTSERKFRAIFENAIIGIFKISYEGIYIDANLALAKLYGYNSPEELIADMSDSQHQLYVEPHRHVQFLEILQKQGELYEFESLIYRRDGSTIWISENTCAVYDNYQKILYYQGFAEDITARKQAEIDRKAFTKELFQINKAYQRFVPHQFLELLNKLSIIDVELGDHVQLEMSVLFSDIRDFTTISESMTPEENFKFINSYLSYMEPVIIENQGFIDKYIGDAIMALFSGEADNAVKAGISMLQNLGQYNQYRIELGYSPIKIGIGINTGHLMLGTVGGKSRIDGTVISDAVNLASRVETLTKNYGVSLLITEQTYFHLKNPNDYAIRIIDTVKVKGKAKKVTVYEVFDVDIAEVKAGKLATLTVFETALSLYIRGEFSQAAELFGNCLQLNPGDLVAKIYFDLCHI
ncbi:PAS domain S-box protein [Dolichospermum sp. UHCC 0259]|uniref:PAS domain S-box protein n=1 Tax=Dolichospermum sp. UHCC 0259 TaxID=2590010 RepID=UPI001446B7BB|nr:adenylate/guanylate cyclase domain-containing protein [Dolichospermum sp. UHCC 0259]MTJ48828.1 PAS domain S-box protein [Dolichospermum sp. UHCC 0259]